MPRGENEAFKASQGRFANKEEARKAGRKGGRAKTMTMHDFKNLANLIDSEEVKNGDKLYLRGEILLRNLCKEAAKGNLKAMKLWLEIKQFGEPKNIDVTSGGERLPNIKLVPSDGSIKLKQSEDEIDE